MTPRRRRKNLLIGDRPIASATSLCPVTMVTLVITLVIVIVIVIIIIETVS